MESRAWIGHPHPELGFYRITVEGYARLAEIEEAVTDSSKAFVAMWFDDSMDGVWENAIKPGIEEAGYEPVRIDRKEHVNRIDDEIIAEYLRILWEPEKLDAFRSALTTRISATIGDGPRAR